MNTGWWRLLLWLLGYLALALLPMAIALSGDPPAVRSRIVETGAMLGLLGLGVLSAQALTSGRQRWFARGLGQDDVLQFHRQTGLLGWGLVLAHPLTMLLGDARFLDYLDPRADWLRATALWTVLLAATWLVATSLWRLSFGLQYEHWRLLHGALALLVVTLGLGHALMVGHYTGPLWKKAALVLVVGASIFAVLETRLLRPRRLQRRPWTVRTLTRERDGSHTLVLQPGFAGGLRFRPGQYAWITLGATPWRLQQHPFSISSGADDDGLAFTIKPLGDFTGRIAQTVKPGDRAFVEGPYGEFAWRPEAAREGAVFVAGGVGITPIISMLRTARTRGTRAPLLLVYGSPDRDTVLFREELDALAQALPLTVVHVLETGHDGWDGETGRIDAALLGRHLPARIDRMCAYLCGPDAMADAVEPVLRAHGVASDRLYSERFGLV
ncbi:ferredoxin reductase family protein [Luteimonas sp. BDR2-5]|uniref:ferredoxin reductase family protein n=1 Tax=Proluteimonas luteida TaxID=2878685 RepID=UPI001E4671A6|nr:ferredoxin reductase family protein [Luteimonas sp. BDR2-5]MCD9028834.1 ferredoxin reductase family protein [Luteimonas sp. BDR2-5]